MATHCANRWIKVPTESNAHATTCLHLTQAQCVVLVVNAYGRKLVCDLTMLGCSQVMSDSLGSRFCMMALELSEQAKLHGSPTSDRCIQD